MTHVNTIKSPLISVAIAILSGVFVAIAVTKSAINHHHSQRARWQRSRPSGRGMFAPEVALVAPVALPFASESWAIRTKGEKKGDLPRDIPMVNHG